VRTVPLGEVVDSVGGGTPAKSRAEFYGGPIPWVTPKDMKAPEISDSKVRITESGLANSSARLVPAGSVLVVVRSGVLKHTLPVALATAPVALNQDMRAFLPGPDIDARYLAHLLRANAPVVLQWVRATTADNFPFSRLLDLPVPLPPLDEQRRIARILDAADQLRAQRRASFDAVARLREAVFANAAVSSSAGWPLVRVADLVDATNGGIRTGPFGSQLLHSEFVESGVSVLGIDNAVANEFRRAAQRYITEDKYEELRRYTVHPGDVLITIMGTCGRVAVVPDDIGIAINTKHLCCISLDRSRCLPRFLHAYFLRHPIARQYLMSRAKGAIMAGLNMGIIKELPVSLPPMELQQAIADRLTAIDRVDRRAVAHADQLDALFASLQHRAFTGAL
jgi:type I restriction enzyme S subunit